MSRRDDASTYAMVFTCCYVVVLTVASGAVTLVLTSGGGVPFVVHGHEAAMIPRHVVCNDARVYARACGANTLKAQPTVAHNGLLRRSVSDSTNALFSFTDKTGDDELRNAATTDAPSLRADNSLKDRPPVRLRTRGCTVEAETLVAGCVIHTYFDAESWAPSGSAVLLHDFEVCNMTTLNSTSNTLRVDGEFYAFCNLRGPRQLLVVFFTALVCFAGTSVGAILVYMMCLAICCTLRYRASRMRSSALYGDLL